MNLKNENLRNENWRKKTELWYGHMFGEGVNMREAHIYIKKY